MVLAGGYDFFAAFVAVRLPVVFFAAVFFAAVFLAGAFFAAEPVSALLSWLVSEPVWGVLSGVGSEPGVFS
ncbi:MAG TPA: hypothetical protein VF049_08135, partial [Nocardioidaceae bacterium]